MSLGSLPDAILGEIFKCMDSYHDMLSLAHTTKYLYQYFCSEECKKHKIFDGLANKKVKPLLEEQDNHPELSFIKVQYQDGGGNRWRPFQHNSLKQNPQLQLQVHNAFTRITTSPFEASNAFIRELGTNGFKNFVERGVNAVLLDLTEWNVKVMRYPADVELTLRGDTSYVLVQLVEQNVVDVLSASYAFVLQERRPDEFPTLRRDDILLTINAGTYAEDYSWFHPFPILDRERRQKLFNVYHALLTQAGVVKYDKDVFDDVHWLVSNTIQSYLRGPIEDILNAELTLSFIASRRIQRVRKLGEGESMYDVPPFPTIHLDADDPMATEVFVTPVSGQVLRCKPRPLPLRVGVVGGNNQVRAPVPFNMDLWHCFQPGNGPKEFFREQAKYVNAINSPCPTFLEFGSTEELDQVDEDYEVDESSVDEMDEDYDDELLEYIIFEDPTYEFDAEMWDDFEGPSGMDEISPFHFLDSPYPRR